MKNKTKTYILLASVLIIWGIIGYKIISTIQPDTPQVHFQNQVVAFKPKKRIEVDTFSINKVNRDPFLGTLYKKKEPIIKIKPKPLKKEFVWLPITYHGAISKTDSKSQVFIVSISGRQCLMKIKQEINGVRIRSGNEKAITVTYKGRSKVVSKS